jgi:uncharacterized protein YndB with AHSA1/START domain
MRTAYYLSDARHISYDPVDSTDSYVSCESTHVSHRVRLSLTWMRDGPWNSFSKIPHVTTLYVTRDTSKPRTPEAVCVWISQYSHNTFSHTGHPTVLHQESL